MVETHTHTPMHTHTHTQRSAILPVLLVLQIKGFNAMATMVLLLITGMI